ncbi:hypothetical protein EYZ11_004086 [Aspergillus tanneri]|uniref:Uncharacterized protein n=1 Tax=Aspergillus tanneri TaxID=1220188 RepID=A0A4S3JNU9_9EURO|nr:uncharacterized protein ATNIH1004_006037 [Aspergillus tanneri]KAA8647345.1 hypothetical protein ATNIH1004_006037 [Aspergillus tanneri]THC96437.1 hypothetical protein EYZ11_004086 [Aspergillus tanneri]
MPSIDFAGSSPASPEQHLDHVLFKSHKSLPRRTDIAPNIQVIHVTAPDQDDNPSKGASLVTAPALPLTPPNVVQDEVSTAPDSEVAAQITPSKPSHPPTPQTTPPRLTPTTHRAGTNPVGQTPSSSRAESFQTACEMISDGETEMPRRPSPSLQRPTKQKTPPNNGSLEPPEDTIATKANPNTGQAAGMAIHEQQERNAEDPATVSQRPKYTNDLRPGALENTELSDSARDANKMDGDSLDVPQVRVRRLRDRVQGSPDRIVSHLSMERFREQIGWPSGDHRADPADPDNPRRLSGVSTSSTIEAMIIDSPRPTKRTLRHSEKRVSLRSASSPVTRSERSSLVSNPDSQRRLVHKIARITDNDRRSVISENSTSESSTLGVPRQNVEVVPVVVIPERRSSLKSSPCTSRKPSKTGSRRSGRQSPTMSGSRPGSLDLPRQKKRTMSESSATTRQEAESRGRSFGRPVIPPRSSSLSAPTSQNNSRSTSLTSESLRNHNLAIQNALSDLPLPTPMKDESGLAPDISKTQSILIGVEDMAHLRPPSAPFTTVSIPSSSPGPVEINEATMVAFFPHNNESLLLVDPQMQTGSRGPRVAYQRSFAKPRTPEAQVLDSAETGEMSSPLKNPRRPPKPPVHKGPPPVSTNGTERQLRELRNIQETHDRLASRFGSGRRSWTARPRSESFNSFTRSLSLRSAKNRKAGKDIDGKLHPFWRPRRFWEDASEVDGDSPQGESPQPSRAETEQVINNSLGMPQQRVVFEGPPISPRNPDMKRRLHGATLHGSRSALVGSGVFTPEALYSQTSLHQRQFQSLSWWRLRLHFGTASGLRRRLRRKMQRRAEGKREARREKLKQSIGEAVLVGSSTQTRSMIQ